MVPLYHIGDGESIHDAADEGDDGIQNHVGTAEIVGEDGWIVDKGIGHQRPAPPAG